MPTLSFKDIRFLSTVYKIAAITGLTPFYSFTTSTTAYPTWKNLQAVALMLVITTGTIDCLYARYYFFCNEYSTPYILVDFFNEFIVVVMLLTTMYKSAFNSQAEWARMNNNLQYIDRVLALRNRNETWVLHNVHVQFFAYQFLYISYTYYVLGVWVGKIGTTKYRMYWLNEICYWYDNLVHFLIFNLARVIQHRYSSLNKILEREIEARQYIDRTSMYMVKFLRRLGELSRVLREVVDSFNSIFGWPIVFLMGKSVSTLLICVNAALIQPSDEDVFKPKLMNATIILAGYTLLSFALVIFYCDAVSVESTRTIFLCYKLQEFYGFEAVERSEVLKLAKQLAVNRTDVSAANFFNVQKNMFFGIFGTTATYAIILIQFHG